MLRKTTLRIAGTAALALLAAPLALAQERNISFVACPIFQDTDTVPCWLAEYEGELYFLGIQTDAGGWSPPWLGHQLLVEGNVSDNPRVCGGIVLESSGTPYDRRSSGSSAGVELPNPPVTSVMRELDATCRTQLPEVDAFNTIEPRRGPGPSPAQPPRTPDQAAAAAAARDAALAAEREAMAKIVPPYQPRDYEMLYEFDSELAVFTIGEVEKALEYAALIGASKILVTGYRSSSLLSNGQQLEEAPFIAKRRAQELESTLRMLGIPQGVALEVTWEDAVVPGNGVNDWSRRRALVRVIP
ncbi:MAG: hypothetical protein RLZZ227_472 [Pseudomonadota bacterium]|jgi:hypothetical protein